MLPLDVSWELLPVKPRDCEAQIGLICDSPRAGFADADGDQSHPRLCFSSYNKCRCCVDLIVLEPERGAELCSHGENVYAHVWFHLL